MMVYLTVNIYCVIIQIESGMVGMMVIEDAAGSEMAGYDDIEIILQLYRYLEEGGFVTMQRDIQDYFR